MLKKVLALCIFILCFFVSGCGEKRPPTLGITPEEFLNVYNEKIGNDNHLLMNKTNGYEKSNTKPKFQDDHKDGYILLNYNYIYHQFVLTTEGGNIKITIHQDIDNEEIISIIVGTEKSYSINYTACNDIIKVLNAVADTVSQKKSGINISEELRIEALKKYNGHNKFDNIVDRDNIAYYYSFHYNPTVTMDDVCLVIACNESKGSNDHKKQNYPKGIVNNSYTGNHTGDLTPPSMTNPSFNNSASPHPQTTAQQSSNSSDTIPLSPQAEQNIHPQKTSMKKEIIGTEAINGFWNGDPHYPVIGVSGNMTKIVDKSSIKFNKSEHEEQITMDVYGFTKAQGQCWQETFTFLRKGRTSNYYSSITDSGMMLMEFVKDSAVHEAYKIGCETVGVPFEMEPSW